VTEIKSVEEAKRQFAKWKREFPEEWSDNLLHEEPRWGYLGWKHFMESKGFHFSMSDEEFVKECEWLNMTRWEKLKAWLKKKPDPQKLIKGYRRLAMIYAAMGILWFVLASFTVYQMAESYKTGGFEVTTLEQWRALAFLSCLSAFMTISIIAAGFMFLLAIYHYSQSLGLRIKQLEKKVEEEKRNQAQIAMIDSKGGSQRC
jgi:hypothetical protein